MMGTGDVSVLAEGVSQSGAVRSRQFAHPEELFRPVRRLLSDEPMALLRLEQLLAKGAWHRHPG